MKKLCAVSLALFLIQVTSSFAWVGGPWSRNSHSAFHEGGIYQAIAVVRNNGSGIMRYAIDTTTVSFPDNGISVWWYRGITYVGNAFGVVDTVTGIVGGTCTASSADNRAINDTGINREILTANWHGHLTRPRFPTLRFTGSGTIALFGDLDTVDINFDRRFVTGAQTGPNGEFIEFIVTNTENLDGSGGERTGFEPVGHQRRIRVYGNRTSTVPPTN